MKKMKKTFLAGTAFAVSAASALTMSGCFLFKQPPAPTVYGPPEMFELPTPADHIQKETTIEVQTDFSVEEEILEDVYGPPEWFESNRE